MENTLMQQDRGKKLIFPTLIACELSDFYVE